VKRDDQHRNPEGQPGSADAAVVQAGGPRGEGNESGVQSNDRRPPDREGEDPPAAGDTGIRGEGLFRHGHYRQGLDRGTGRGRRGDRGYAVQQDGGEREHGKHRPGRPG
jgi:hypothetical protein